MRLPVTALMASMLVMTLVPAAGPAHAQAEPPPTGTDPVEVVRTVDPPPTVTSVEVAPLDGFDRIVVQLSGELPGYRVEYVDQVVEPDPSGAPVPLRGDAALRLEISPAVAEVDAGLTFPQPQLPDDLNAVQDVTYAGSGASAVRFGVGVAERLGFRVFDLADPARVVVDVAHPAAPARVPAFTDIEGNVHRPGIEAISSAGVTEGCDPDGRRYCPDGLVSREQMASFLVRALDLPASAQDRFTDDEGSVHEESINALAAAGVTAGCEGDRFCPSAAVSRAQMASFLVRGFGLPAAGDNAFVDDAGSVHEAAINALAAAGVTAGCDATQTRYCPTASVRRDQMATFLARALDLIPRADPPWFLERGDQGPRVATLQSQLTQLRYFVGGVDGIFGVNTQQAVTAFQKAHGLARDGIYGPITRAAMQSPREVGARSTSGLVMEVDEARQLLLLVRDGVVQTIFNTSTGTEQPYSFGGVQYLADTPNGQWTIYRQIDGWRESHLGRLYRPKYFHTDGIAIHGYPNVPPYPASHGCVRVSMDAMDHLWPQLPIGTAVWVY